jgi:flagellar hook assembly protein FlgD
MRRIGGGPWENFYKQEKLFDSNGRLIDYSFFSWTNGLWKEIRFSTRGYNNAGFETLRIEKDTVAGVLTNRDFHGTTYDTLNRKTFYTWQKWVNGNWQFYLDDQYHYNGNSLRLDSVEHKFWDTNTNSFKKSGRSFYLYNGQGQLVQKIRQQLQTNTYTNSSMLEFGYDNFGNKNATVSFNWDNANNSWRPSSGDYYTFDIQGRTTEYVIKQVDNNNQLKNVGRTQTTFASDSSIIIETGANWINGTWVVLYKNEWVFENVGVTSIEDFSENKATLKTYPNPFTTNTIIEFESVKAAEATIQIADYTGRIVFESQQMVLSGKNSFLWNAVDKNGTALTSGMYFLKLKSNNQSFHTKLLKQ